MSNTKERIVNASLELFAEQGYQLTTVKMIAKKVGVNELTIYRHFGSKDKILENVLSVVSIIQPNISNYLKNDVVYDLKTDLLNVAKIFVKINEDYYYFMKFLLRADTNRILPNRELEIKELFDDYFLVMKKLGKIVSIDHKSLTLLYFSTLQGAFLLKEQYKEEGIFLEPTWSSYIETVVKVLLKGLEVE
ncbi:TetR/AcrR family transcriptional regulator [Chengkuizengella sp. SCS-71B]|uniref:TetR/AcrR family transcriptional regulator n=1 Tax=Chengkuizengella sp. SCS-71B TaxID=3115290 RepID=UPI0032C22572